ncbi:MAG: hypothetical protein ACR2FN_10845 [Chitinophagaceae bacterium]
MNQVNVDTLNTEFILENITQTLLYEGYALYPYHRSAIKNQKPIPFGVVFPQQYNIYNEHSHSKMQTQCIVTGSDNLQINISVRFLHLLKVEIFEKDLQQKTSESDFVQVHNVSLNGKIYQAGWQTIERKISTGNLQISQLIKNRKVIFIKFDKVYDTTNISDENGETVAKQINSVSQIKGTIIVEAESVKNTQNAFRITVTVTNTTPFENTEAITRDEVLTQSFLSTHIILNTSDGQFISHQDPDEKWKTVIDECANINTWPILIDEANTTLLSSPIILYDHPQINPQSHGDLFDSTEIEEALLLHVNLLSDEEKKRISQSDEKLQAMLKKVGEITPEELINFHSGLKESTQIQINNEKF